MRIVFDQGTPVPLREHLPDHTVRTAYEQGWASLHNGDLLARAEQEFDLLITTDRNLKYQQNLDNRRIAILVLWTTSWPKLRLHGARIAAAVNGMQRGEYLELGE